MILGWPCWIGVVVDDLERQRHFYRDILGFTEVAHGSDWAHFDLGDARLLEIMRRGDRPQIDQARYQVGYAVEDVRTAREHLIARGCSQSVTWRAVRQQAAGGATSGTRRARCSSSRNAAPKKHRRRRDASMTHGLRPGRAE